MKDQAIEMLDILARENPKNADAYFALGNVYAEKGEYEKAILNYNDAIKLEKDNIRFKSHLVFLQLILSRVESQKNENIDIEKEILSLIELNPQNAIGYTLLANFYFFDAINYRGTEGKYSKAISNLYELKHFSKWQTIYPTPEQRMPNASKFVVIADSTKYFDEAGEEVGYIKQDVAANINSVGDTIIFTDPEAYKLIDNYVWKLENVQEKIGDYTWRKRLNYSYFKDRLFREPKCAYRNTPDMTSPQTRNWVYAGEISRYGIENELVSYTGKTQKYVAQEWSHTAWKDVIFTWKQVKYNTREYLTRKIPNSDRLIFLKDDTAYLVYSFKENLKMEQDIIHKIFDAGHIALGMTTDLLWLNVDCQSIKYEFNKENYKQYYKCQPYEFVFVDGMLSEINLSPAEDTPQK